MSKKAIWVVTSILLIYFMFTSGFTFEATKSKASDRIDIPYSIGLSAERTGVSNVVDKDDMECILWLKENWNGKSDVVTDYNTYCSVLPYIPVYFNLFYNDRKGMFHRMPEGECYIFVSSWNTRHQKYIEAIGVGRRKSYPLPEFSYPIIKQCGSTIIYFKELPPEPKNCGCKEE